MAEFNDALLNARFTFRVRPIPVPSLMRPVRRVSLLVLLFDQCRSKQATMLQIQVLNWAIRNTENRARFNEYLEGAVLPGEPVRENGVESRGWNGDDSAPPGT